MIRVDNGNRVLRRKMVSFPIPVFCRIKLIIRLRVTACRIPKMKNIVFSFILFF